MSKMAMDPPAGDKGDVVEQDKTVDGCDELEVTQVGKRIGLHDTDLHDGGAR